MIKLGSFSTRRAYVAPGCDTLEFAAQSEILQGSPSVGVDGLQEANLKNSADYGFDSWD